MDILPSSIHLYGKDVWSSYLPLSTCMVRMYEAPIFLYPPVWYGCVELLSSSITIIPSKCESERIFTKRLRVLSRNVRRSQCIMVVVFNVSSTEAYNLWGQVVTGHNFSCFVYALNRFTYIFYSWPLSFIGNIGSTGETFNYLLFSR